MSVWRLTQSQRNQPKETNGLEDEYSMSWVDHWVDIPFPPIWFKTNSYLMP